MSYVSDRAFSDRMLPEIRRIVGPLLLNPAPLDLDISEATDLIVLRARDMRIAARVRKFGYFQDYGDQFTIRARRDSGAATELAKIVEGWGDWLFYGHADAGGTKIDHWMIVDLDAFRAALIRDATSRQKRLRYGNKDNGDGTYFKWFKVGSFNWCVPPLLIAASSSVQQLANIEPPPPQNYDPITTGPQNDFPGDRPW